MLPLYSNRALLLLTVVAFYILNILNEVKSDDQDALFGKRASTRQLWMGSRLGNRKCKSGKEHSKFSGRHNPKRPHVRQMSCGSSTVSDISELIDLSRMSDRVAGGYAAEPGQFPSYVYLSINNGFSMTICGGTIIGSDLVVTAAHCTNGVKEAATVKVKPLMTSDEIEENGGWIKAAKICQSTEYVFVSEGVPRYDLAVLKLETPFEFNERVQPACLPDRPMEPEEQAFAVGMGYLESETHSRPDVLQVMPLKQSSCLIDQHDSILCAKSNSDSNPGDTCSGDSGGPFLVHTDGTWTLYGVTSYGPDECKSGSIGTGVYSNLYNLKSELDSLISQCQVE